MPIYIAGGKADVQRFLARAATNESPLRCSETLHSGGKALTIWGN
jgi:hypothetical protein